MLVHRIYANIKTKEGIVNNMYTKSQNLLYVQK